MWLFLYDWGDGPYVIEVKDYIDSDNSKCFCHTVKQANKLARIKSGKKKINCNSLISIIKKTW